MDRDALRDQVLGLFKVEQYDRALGLIESILVQHANDIWFLNQAAHAYFQLERYEEAIEVLNGTSARKPSHFAHRLMGSCSKELGRYDVAVEHYSLALETKESATVWFFLRFCQRRLGRVDEAIASYERVIQIDPNYDEAMLNLAFAIEESDPQRAVALIKRAIEIDPDYTFALLHLGRMLLAQGKPEAAKRALRRAMELDPNDFDMKLYLAAALDDLNEPDEELNILLSARDDRPADPLVHRMLGNLYLWSDQLDEAIKSYGRAFELDSSDARAVYGIARTRHAMGNGEEAIRLFRLVLALEPDFVDKYGLAKELGIESR